MKNLSSKLFAVVFAVIAVLSAGLTMTACDNACKDGHNFVLTSSTATCTESGTEFYSCAKCNETKSEAVAAYGHNYNKNVCDRCTKKLTDLSQFPESYRKEISDKLLLIAPYTVESETFAASSMLYKLALDDVDDCKTALTKAQTAYDNACNEATIRRFNPVTNQWEWVVDEKKVAAAESNLKKAENNLKQAEADLQIYKTGYEFNCEGYAWYAAVMGIKATDASNKAVNSNVKTISAFVSALNETTALPDFYKTIINAIYDLTGINISYS